MEPKERHLNQSYSHRDSFLGNFAKASAPDFVSAQQPYPLGDMADAAKTKGGGCVDSRIFPKNEIRCVLLDFVRF